MTNDFSKLPFQELITELKDYAKEEAIKTKAQRVIIKCLKAGKYKLAEKIEERHRHYLPRFDSVVAFGYSLLASKTQL